MGLAELIRKEGTANVYVETNDITHDKSLLACLLPNFDKSKDGLMGKNIKQDVDLIITEDNLNVSVDLDVAEDDLNASGSESSNDDEDRLVEVPFMEDNIDIDEEIKEAREKVQNYIQLKKNMQKEDDENLVGIDVENGDERDNINTVDEDIIVRVVRMQNDKVIGYQSKYMDSSDPGSHEDTRDDSAANDAK